MTTPGDLSVLIDVLVNDEASGQIAALPEQIQAAVREINAILQPGFGAEGFQKFFADLQQGTVGLQTMREAVAGLEEALAALGTRGADLPFIQNLRAQMESLRSFGEGLLNSGGLAGQQNELLRIRDAASDSGAIAAANVGTDSLSVLSAAGVSNESTYAAELAQRERKLELLRQEKAEITGSDAYAQESGKRQQAMVKEVNDQIEQQIRKIADLKTAYRELATGQNGLPVPGASAALVNDVLGSANPRIALLQQQLALQEQITQNLAASDAHVNETTASLQRQLAIQQQLTRAVEQQDAAQAKAAAEANAGGGSFFGGFGAGFLGSHGGNDGLSPENLGFQIGQVSKYVLFFEAFIKGQDAIRQVVEQTKLYQEGLVRLDIALQSVQGTTETLVASQTQLNSLVGTAAQGGLGPGDALTIAARGIQAYHSEIQNNADQQRVAQESVAAATVGSVVAQDKYADVQTRLIAVTREFNLGVDGQSRVLDAATNANRRFGASTKEVLDGLSQVSGLAVQSGFSVEQLANAIGLIVSNTGLTGASAAGDLKRIIGGEGGPSFQKALTAVGVDTSQSLEKELEQLGEKFKTLNQAQQENVITTLGGRRSAEALIPLLQQIGDYQAANAYSLANAGAAQKEYDKQQDTLAGVLRQLGGAFKQLAADIGTSGVGTGFGILLETGIQVLRMVDDVVQAVDLLPKPFREAAFAVGELVLAFKLLQAAQDSSLFGKVTSGLASVAGGARNAATEIDAATVATEANTVATEASAVAPAARIPGLLGISGAVGGGAATTGVGAGEAGLGATAAGGAATGLLGPLTAILGTVAAYSVLSRAGQFNGAQANANSLLSYGGGSADDLNTQASRVATAAQKLKDQRDSITGTIANLIDGGVADRTISRLKNFSSELSAEAQAIQVAAEKSVDPSGAVGIFGDPAQLTVDKLTNGVKALTDSGYSASQVLDALNAELNLLTGNTAKGLANLTKGGVAVTGGSADAFISSVLFGSVIPGSVPDLSPSGLARAVNKSAFGTGPGAPTTPVNDSQILGSQQLIDQLVPKINVGDFRGKIRQVLEADIGDKQILTPADQDQIATDVAKVLSPDPRTQKYIHDKLVANLRTLSGADAAGESGYQSLLKQDPQLVGTLVQLVDSAAKGAVSDANARGATTSEVQQLQQKELTNLQALLAAAKATGAPTGEIQQQIAATTKDIFDTYAKHIDEIAKVEEANATPAQKAAIEAKVKQLKTLANKIEGEGGTLPTDFQNLNQAQVDTTNAATALAAKQAAAAKAIIDQANADAAAWDTQAATLEKIAARDDINPTHAAASLNAAQHDLAQAAIDRAAATAATAPVKVTLADPAAQPGIDASGGGTGGGGSHDTAAQIAAAQAAANVFPGAKVEEAAVAIQAAAADLAAQTPGTVAYYRALQTLRKSQYDFTQAVLDAQHVARELAIDLTNPLAVAQEELRTAQAKLASDRAKGAPSDVVNEDLLKVRQAAAAAEKTRFEQNLQDVQTNLELGRITESQYLAYLDAQHNTLTKIAHRTYQQQQELNEVDKLIREAAKQLEGQFNLGDIKLPSVYQVRQAIQGGAGAQVAAIQQVSISISGGDIAVIKNVLAQYLGPSAFARTPITTAKVA